MSVISIALLMITIAIVVIIIGGLIAFMPRLMYLKTFKKIPTNEMVINDLKSQFKNQKIEVVTSDKGFDYALYEFVVDGKERWRALYEVVKQNGYAKYKWELILTANICDLDYKQIGVKMTRKENG